MCQAMCTRVPKHMQGLGSSEVGLEIGPHGVEWPVRG